MSGKIINDGELEQVSGGIIEVDNTLYDPRTTQVNHQNAVMDDNTIVTSRLLAGEAQQTGNQNNPLKINKTNNTNKTNKPIDPFGPDLNAGSGLA